MAGKCSNPDCPAPISCHEGIENYRECPFWVVSDLSKAKVKDTGESVKKSDLPWSGEAFSTEELAQITVRNSPVIIGLVGKAGSGKTTYLAMLFTLFLRGEMLENWDFSGTKTIKVWDELYQKLKVNKEKVAFPNPTPAEYIRLLHLAMRNKSKRLKDFFLTDTSGEVFSIWSQNREDENAQNARWVYSNANGFIFFIDCIDLINRKNRAKTEIIDLVQMLKHDLRGRPVIAVWSKSDKINEVHPKIRESLQEELRSHFENFEEIYISNFSSDDPDILVHKNNISVLDWMFSKVFSTNDTKIAIENGGIKNDFFLNYKGSK